MADERKPQDESQDEAKDTQEESDELSEEQLDDVAGGSDAEANSVRNVKA
jgi:hypothetical protein